MEVYYIAYALMAYIVYRDLINDRRINRLIDRLMAKDYKEFEYYDKKFDNDVKEVERLRDEARKAREEVVETDIEAHEDPDVQKFMAGLESDWSPAEIDRTKIRKVVED